MKIEEGKFYRTRTGVKVGPLRSIRERSETGEPLLCAKIGDEDRWFRPNGSNEFGVEDYELVAEWAEERAGPVRTITRKEIVPGTYGIVEVSDPPPLGPGELYAGRLAGVRVANHGAAARSCTAAELRAAAATLTEIADALGEAS